MRQQHPAVEWIMAFVMLAAFIVAVVAVILGLAALGVPLGD